jgi:hypothetical protein
MPEYHTTSYNFGDALEFSSFEGNKDRNQEIRAERRLHDRPHQG